MDFLDTLIGVIALALAAISLWQGRRSSDAISKRFEEFERANERQARANERQSHANERLSDQSARQANHIDALLEIVRLIIGRL